MTCDLDKGELAVLYALHRHHCFNDKDSNDIAIGLAKKGYVAQKKKTDVMYYICYIRATRFALHLHDYNVPLPR